MKNQNSILIIFGISGDLSKRFLLPAITQMAKLQMLPENFRIVGITRKSNLEISELLTNIPEKDYLQNHIEIFSMDVNVLDEYKKLSQKIDDVEKKIGKNTDKIFYLAVPPKGSKDIIKYLGESGLSQAQNSKLLLEKPFGINLKDASEMAKYIDRYFKPEQIYRVDHYIAKEIAQNIIVFRDGNSLFKRTWNNKFIESIEITASEKIGIEGRANFYEQTGALRDYIQNHLLQLLSLTIMDLPDSNKLSEVPAARLKALKKLKVVTPFDQQIKIGQYEGYKEDAGNPSSQTETFASVVLKSTDPKWKNVPMTISAGKSMNEKFTEIKISYKKDSDDESNELLLCIQPDESVKFGIWAKRPGYERVVDPHFLSFNLREHYPVLPQAYEQVLFSALNSDHSLFTSTEEVLQTWKILNPLQKEWDKLKEKQLIIYKKGTDIKEIIKRNK